MDIDFDGVYRPYWEHTIYIPNAVYEADHAKQYDIDLETGREGRWSWAIVKIF